jgi:hypothetical protein
MTESTYQVLLPIVRDGRELLPGYVVTLPDDVGAELAERGMVAPIKVKAEPGPGRDERAQAPKA